MGGGGVAGEPQLKKRRTEFKHDGPVEDEETARKKMEEAGFDPDDVMKECTLSRSAHKACSSKSIGLRMRPMTYFCRIGDLKMCRYLLSKGASTMATPTSGFWFPMYTAALGGHLDVCKWLYNHGAKDDISRSNSGNYTPLSAAVNEHSIDRKNTSRWFILKGVLSLDEKPGFVDTGRMRRDLEPEHAYGVVYDERPQLLEWARQSVQNHSGFMTFLLGTLPAPAFTHAALRRLLSSRLHSNAAVELLMKNTPDHQYEFLWSEITKCMTPVRYLGGIGTNGIIEIIADYAGVVRGRDLRILRNLIDPLSEYLEEVPEGEPDFGESDDDEEEEGDDETDENEDEE